MNKRIVSILIIMLAIISNITYAQDRNYKNDDTGYSVIIEDDASLLSDIEIERIIEDMIPLTEYGNILFKSINSNSTTASSYAESYYHSKCDMRSNGSLFLIDMDNRKIYIFSDGQNYKVITSSKAEIITDNIYRYASNKDYYTCASEAYKQMNSLLAGYKISEPMRYRSNILIALVLGFFINFLVILSKTKVHSASDSEILKKAKISFKILNVTSRKVGESKVYSPQSSGSSSGGSSGGGGGGGSSGGGGGHSF